MSECTLVKVDRPTSFGSYFMAGTRTAAHIEWTFEQFAETYAKTHPGAHLAIMQGCYHTGYKPSAGTHDFDQVLDWRIYLADGSIAPADDHIHWFRTRGWWGWWRTPAEGFVYHFHAISGRRRNCQLGVFVPQQITDYRNHALGLAGAGHTPGSDHTWYPADINATIFDYAAWQEAHMPLNKDDLTAVRAIVREEVGNVLDVDVNAKGAAGDPDFNGVTLRSLLKTVYRRVTKA